MHNRPISLEQLAQQQLFEEAREIAESLRSSELGDGQPKNLGSYGGGAIDLDMVQAGPAFGRTWLAPIPGTDLQALTMIFHYVDECPMVAKDGSRRHLVKEIDYRVTTAPDDDPLAQDFVVEHVAPEMQVSDANAEALTAALTTESVNWSSRYATCLLKAVLVRRNATTTANG